MQEEKQEDGEILYQNMFIILKIRFWRPKWFYKISLFKDGQIPTLQSADFRKL